jgi:hypothetical protein
MQTEQVDVRVFLKPRDLATIPQRRGRQASTLYARLVEAFVSSGEKAMDVDAQGIGRKPETIRSALAKTIKAAGLHETIRVSLIEGQVILLLR